MAGIDLLRWSTVAELGYPDSNHDRLGDNNGTLYWIDSNQVQNQLFPAAAGSFSNFVMSDGSNTQQVDDGETQLFTGSIAIDGTVGATNQLTLNWDLTKLSSASGTLTDSDYLGIYDLSGKAHQRLALVNLPTITSLDSTNDKFTVLDATDSRLKLVAADNFPAAGGGTSIAILHDEKTTTTDGGSSSATTWNARDLNTETADPDGIVSISSNQFTPISGTYRIQVRAPAFETSAQNRHRIRLYNVTQASVVFSGPGNYNSAMENFAVLDYRFTANGTDAYRIDHYTQAAEASVGLGQATDDGDTERYMEIRLEKE